MKVKIERAGLSNWKSRGEGKGLGVGETKGQCNERGEGWWARETGLGFYSQCQWKPGRV